MKRINLKTAVLTAMMLLGAGSINAQVPDSTQVIPLKLKPIEDNGGEQGGIKSPLTPPVVALDGHTLYIISGCDDTVLSLADENETEAYSITILAGTTMITLPEWLQGTYELRILRGQYMFYTEIEL